LRKFIVKKFKQKFEHGQIKAKSFKTINLQNVEIRFDNKFNKQYANYTPLVLHFKLIISISIHIQAPSCYVETGFTHYMFVLVIVFFANFKVKNK